MNEANPYKTGADTYELDKTVNWVGKGYSTRDGKSQYTMTLGDSPSLAFLGEPGQTLYMAPHLTYGNQDPIWAGLGASTKVPTCLLYTSPSPRDRTRSRMPSSA